MPEGMLRDLIVDGAIGGVGSVIVFLPNILLLYLFISLLEDTGYMARTAFITDKLMHRIGLHGKSLIPMVMGLGCNVPSVMATRMIENPKSRLITMLIIPFMSCSARLPVYILLIGAFFPHSGSLVLFALYALGVAVALLSAKVFSKYFNVGEDLPFVMELPPYRIPTLKSVVRHTWEKGQQYLRKMGGLILAFSVVIWALGYFKMPVATDGPEVTSQRSCLEWVGRGIAPVFAPMEFDWQMSVGILSGIGAKELMVSTLGVLYAGEAFDDENAEREICSVVGRCCESGDILQENVPMPNDIARGDLIACLTTGAYHYSMASNYNRIPRPPVVMLNNGESYVAVKRETIEDLARLDI
jgi:ferrous iron transport protein B